MLKFAMLALMVGVMAACETRTVHEGTDTAPTNGLQMSPANEKPPVQPMQQVNDPSRQTPSNSAGRY